MTKLIKTLNGIFWCVRMLCYLMLCTQVLLVTITTLCRNLFHFTPIWGESMSLFLLVWLSMLSASLPIRNDSHIRVRLFDSMLGERGVSALNVLVDILCVVYAVVVFCAGCKMAEQVSNTIITGIKVSKGYLFAAVPTSMVFMILAFFEKYCLRFKEHKDKKEVE